MSLHALWAIYTCIITMVSLSTHCSLSLHQPLVDSCAVTWSTDGRIAVTSPDVIKVFSLCRNTAVDAEPTRLLSNISSVHKHSTKPSPSQTINYRPLLSPHYESTDPHVFLDPTDPVNDNFVRVKWSPVGAGPNGRCLLACMTRYGSLMIYAPPSSLETTWRMVCFVSDELRNLLKTTNYNICNIVDRVPLSSVPSSSICSEDDIQSVSHLKLLSTITTFTWLPVTTHGNGDTCLVLAVAVKAGYLVILSLDSNSSLSPLCVHNLVKDNDNINSTTNGILYWPCAIHLIASSAASTLILVVCFTNGSIKYLQWDMPSAAATTECFTVPRDLNSLWTYTDQIPVHLITHTEVRGDNDSTSTWCIFVKCNHIVIVPVSATCGCYGYISGYHSNAITGLTVLADGTMLTCSRDGVVQTASIPVESLSCNGGEHRVRDLSAYAKKVPSISETKSYMYNGLDTSVNRLFVAIGTSSSSFNKLATSCELQLFSVTYPPDQHDLSHYSLSWDLYEYYRFNNLPLPNGTDTRLQLYIQQLTCDEDSGSEELIMVNFVHEMLSKLHKMATDTITISHQCKLSIRNYHTLLRNHGDSPPMDSIHSYEVPMDEHCAICNEVVPYSCFRGDSCPQGHYWKRCIISQCLITSPMETNTCSLCGSNAYSNRNIAKDTWLSSLLSSNHHCPICGGFFDSFLYN